MIVARRRQEGLGLVYMSSYVRFFGTLLLLTVLSACGGSYAFRNVLAESSQHKPSIPPIGTNTIPLQYSIVDLGPNVFPERVSNTGTVVGYILNSGNTTMAFAYNGSMYQLGTLSGDVESIAYGVNSQGEIVGESDSGPPNYTTIMAVQFSLTGSPVPLGILPNNTWSKAWAVSDSGEIVGASYAIFWGPPGAEMTIFDGMGGTTDAGQGEPYEIDDYGFAVGADTPYGFPDTTTAPFVYYPP